MTTTEQVAAQVLADLSAVVREYLMKETDVTRPSFHATALTTNLASVLAARLDDGLAADRARWTDWLARTHYGIDYWSSEEDPPCTAEELGAAYVRVHGEEDVETWAGTIRAETGAFTSRALLDQPHTGTNP